MTRIGILVLIATILMVLIHLSWDYTGMDSVHDRINKLQMELNKLRRELQIEGILPYDEEEDYWRSYDESADPCVESIKRCV
tara:strand:- start:318 stop:563 length:246 start_codon:yes stop_codon:yes gene_type:complete